MAKKTASKKTLSKKTPSKQAPSKQAPSKQAPSRKTPNKKTRSKKIPSKKSATKSPRASAPQRRVDAAPERSLQSIVGAETYGVWCSMLTRLVPDGRTHRLAPLVAGMLQYAALAASDLRPRPAAGSAAASLREAEQTSDPDEACEYMDDVVRRLFRDAKVPADRANARGDHYSIVHDAIAEFVRWDFMPWE